MADNKILSSDKSGTQSEAKFITNEKGIPGDVNQGEIQTLDIKDRIRESTQSSGLSNLPVGFDEHNGDWICIESSNPFEVLYLDYQQYRFITPEIVRKNYSILEKFWKDKVSLLNTGGNRVAFKSKYGDGTIENSLLKLEKAFSKISTELGIENYFAEINTQRISKGESILFKELDKLTRDGNLSQTDFEVLNEIKVTIELTEEEIGKIIKKLINEKEFISVINVKGEGWMETDELAGNNLLERLSSATWMTRAKFIESKNFIQSVKLGYATIKTDKDFINILETRSTWWEELFEDDDTYFALKSWLGSYQNVESRKIFDNMIGFYKPLGKEYVKESAIRFFDPKREIKIELTSFNFFTTDNVEQEVSSYISKLDEIWKFSTIDKIIFNIFQLEFSLRQLKKSTNKKNEIVVSSLIDKINTVFGLSQISFDDFKTGIQTKLSSSNLKESYLLITNLIYAFNIKRAFKDSNNNEINKIEDIGLLFSVNETVFDNEFNQAELIVYLDKRNMKELYSSTYFEFLFKVFNSKIKSTITINNIRYFERTLKINYKINKSLEEFFESKGIISKVIEKGENQIIEIKTSLIPKPTNTYDELLNSLFKKHSISTGNCDSNSLTALKEYIYKDINSYIKENRNDAGLFSWGIISYAIPAIVALIGLYFIYSPNQMISEYLHSIDNQKNDEIVRVICLIGFVYLAIIISMLPALLFWGINNEKGKLHDSFKDGFMLYPHHLIGSIILWYGGTVVFGFILAIILFIVVGIGSIFGDFKTDPTVDLILVFLAKLTSLAVIIASFRPIYKFIEGTSLNSKIINTYVLKQVAFWVAILIFAYSLYWVLYENGLIMGL